MQTPFCVRIVSTHCQVDGRSDKTRARVGRVQRNARGRGESSWTFPCAPAPTADDSTEIVSALEFDMTQLDSDHDVSGSDTESCAADDPPAISHAPRDRRLRLIWSQDWHPDARAAECVMRELGNRIGHVPVGSPLPRAIRQQRWSPLNVPLMWAAASGSDTTPVLQWLMQMGSRITGTH